MRRALPPTHFPQTHNLSLKVGKHQTSPEWGTFNIISDPNISKVSRLWKSVKVMEKCQGYGKVSRLWKTGKERGTVTAQSRPRSCDKEARNVLEERGRRGMMKPKQSRTESTATFFISANMPCFCRMLTGETCQEGDGNSLYFIFDFLINWKVFQN